MPLWLLFFPFTKAIKFERVKRHEIAFQRKKDISQIYMLKFVPIRDFRNMLHSLQS